MRKLRSTKWEFFHDREESERGEKSLEWHCQGFEQGMLPRSHGTGIEALSLSCDE
jgi:hypothetical protein